MASVHYPMIGNTQCTIDQSGSTLGAHQRIYLHAGQTFVSDVPASVVTVVGSCVALCLFDPVRQIAAVNHYLLPLPISGSLAGPRFGEYANRFILDALISQGATPRNITAKLFGGASMFAGRNTATVGEQNVELARRFLHERGIPLLAEDVGGRVGRKVIYETVDGTAYVKAVHS